MFLKRYAATAVLIAGTATFTVAQTSSTTPQQGQTSSDANQGAGNQRGAGSDPSNSSNGGAGVTAPNGNKTGQAKPGKKHHSNKQKKSQGEQTAPANTSSKQQ